ncbi:MAG: NAD(P)/FAD-dependent oxidoreductase [Halothiobacillaceae bacterium]|nr:MAG: NAD(P)/FAD-dependent oxidoreductase [Halothiobacillaceae bacterium]
MVSKDMRPDAGRRKFLFGSAAAVASLAGIESAIAGMRSDKSVHVVIIGSGAAGMAIANRLNRALPKGKLTVIDPRAPSYYWPGLTLVATGLWPESKTLIDTADYMPARAEWVKESVKVIDAANNSVQTDTGRNIAYDYLVVAPGVEYDYAAIEGMDEKAIGTNGLASVYHSPAKATASWTAIHKFVNEGGQGIYTMPSTPIRCAGAPLKMTFLTLDRIKQAGTQAKAKIDFHSALGNVFSLPFFSDYTINRWKEDGVPTHLKSDLKAVDLGARKARFATGQGDVELTYDLLHVVPPMRAPAFVRDSELSWKEGNFAEGGWLAVDQGTLQHMDFKNVFGCGDVNGTPRGKTAATVKLSAPLVVANLLSVIEGKEPELIFNGYTSCPLLTKFGSAMLVEFDYEGNLTPTFSFIDPKKESWFAWVMKEQMLKPTYLKMLEGRV